MELWEITDAIRTYLMDNPSGPLMKAMQNIQNEIRYRKLITDKLVHCGEWSKFAPHVLLELANKVDEPFVKLMLRFEKDGVKYSAISFYLWWRRMKALGDEHLITYVNYTKLLENGKDIGWVQVMANCALTKDVLEVFDDDKSVELVLRTKLGISMSADIEEAWKKWAKANHPDRGGNTETFILTKASYEEWKAIQEKHK